MKLRSLKFSEKDSRMAQNKKTEHTGAKNGGGNWGTREEAKSLSKKVRRTNSKEIVENEMPKLQRDADDAPAYFKLNRKELSQALQTLDSQSSELDDYNISYGYDEDLNELPENPNDIEAYADLLIARSRVEMEKPALERNWLQISKSLGMAGSLRKMTGQFGDAEKLLRFSLHIIDQHELKTAYKVQQNIRLCDVWKRTGAYEDALQGLTEIIDLCSRGESLYQYLDVAIQHLGKIHFSLGNIEIALQSFERALNLRLKKKDQNLIDSSQHAIEACRLKLAQHK